MGSYATDDDVFACLSAQAFVVRQRPVLPADVDGATGTVRLDAHGLTADDVITFKVTSGGALPTGVTAFAPYYPTPTAFDLFKVAASLGGALMTFASVGSGWGVVVDPLRRIAFHRAQTAALIDQHLMGYTAPIVVDPSTGLYPPVLVGLNARMTARAAVTSLQVENAAFKVAVDRLFAQEEFDNQILDRLSRDGWVLNPAPKPAQEANLAISESVVSPRGWDGRCPGRLP